MRIHPVFLFLACCVPAGTLCSQDNIAIASQTKGLSAGVRLGYLSYTNDAVHPYTEGGIGFGLQVEYGFTHQIAAAFSFQHFSVNSETENNTTSPYPYNEIDLTGKYIFGSTDSKLRPYLSLGFNYTRTNETFYYINFNLETLEKYSGASFCGGGGLSYFFNSQVSAEFSCLIHSGDFTSVIINGDVQDETFTFFSVTGLAGIYYHF